VREISEGDIELMYTMEIVSPKDLEFREPKVSKYWKLSLQALFNFLVLGDALGLSGTDCKKKNKPH
jgi:hypothetical protein